MKLLSFGCTVALLAAGCGEVEAPTDLLDSTENDEALQIERPRGVVMWRDSSAPQVFSAPAGTHLNYYGGRINSASQVINVLWGAGAYDPHVSGTGTPSMASFYQQVLNGPLNAWLDSEYNTVSPSGTKTNQHIGAGAFIGQYTITPANTANLLSDAQIKTEITAQIAAGKLPAPTIDSDGNPVTYYSIFFPPGKKITQGNLTSCQAGGFCAYHGTVAASGSRKEFYYGVLPDMKPGSGCDTGCGTGGTFDFYTSVASHELIEMITDPEVGIAAGFAAPLAWYDTTHGEIGDMCNTQRSSYVGCDGQTYTIQNEFSNARSDCIAWPNCGAGGVADFSISAAPASLNIARGASASATVSTGVVSGSGNVSLEVTGAPSGVTVALSQNSVTAGSSSTLSVTVATSAALGSFTLTITGTEGSKTHTTTVGVTVGDVPVTINDFTISASPSSVSLSAGTSTTSTLSTAVVSGSGSVALVVSGAPAGITATLNSASVAAGGSATLTIAVSAGAAAGNSTLTITGTEGSISHSTNVTVSVLGAPVLVNGNFETATLTGWTVGGPASNASVGCHGGRSCAQLGPRYANRSRVDTTLAQSFTAPSGASSLVLWYRTLCFSASNTTVAAATLTDTTAGTTSTILARMCSGVGSWTSSSARVIGGHRYTLTLIAFNTNNNASASPAYTDFDDVVVQ